MRASIALVGMLESHSYGALYARIVDAQNRDLEAAEEAWRFFSAKRSR